MGEELSVESLRAALVARDQDQGRDEAQRFEALARRFERAVGQLVEDIRHVLARIPELEVVLEDEEEVFSSPAFPGRTLTIRDRRLRVRRGDDFLLFDPTAKALLSALGQVEIESSRPIPFLIERVLYLSPGRESGRAVWGYRSVEDLGGPLAPFGEQALLRMLHAVFAAS